MTNKGVPSGQEEEVQITFVKSKSGKKGSIPVWFTINQGKMELLPMYGSRSKWFLDVEKGGKMSLQVKDWKMEASPTIIRDLRTVDSIKGRFGMKYGKGDVKRYYPAVDVAIEIPL